MDLGKIEGVMRGVKPVLDARIERHQSVYGRGPDEGKPLTWGFCRGGAEGARQVLEHEFPDIEWRLRGGYAVTAVEMNPGAEQLVDFAALPGGMLDVDGEWRSHFWVEGELRSGGTVFVDLTADQFGHDDVVVTVDDGRYKANILPAYRPLTTIEKGWADSVYMDWRFGPPPSAPPRALGL